MRMAKSVAVVGYRKKKSLLEQGFCRCTSTKQWKFIVA